MWLIISGEVKDGVLRIGHTTMSVYNPENGMMVPDTLFYENPQVRAGHICLNVL